ncbi:TMV RESISTANCE PROTEIN N-LIKE [Salix purpurea]|uniref:ADP-ribosyl cyclase/cyclic ADP-ribose hydrolase n=1 Tax=Salix purpurea TaxID=77065 RepID=A0A9Q0URM2_SALPP|nr:TMV RESISTANCE PROTEIN N-LIKE [Salix purpurea]
MANRSRLLQTIEESRLSVIIFARDHTSLTLCFDELVNKIRFMSERRPNTFFPVSYDAKQSKIDDQTGMYTIVFDKDEENCKDDAKVKRWMDILIGVVNYEKSRRGSATIAAPSDEQGVVSVSVSVFHAAGSADLAREEVADPLAAESAEAVELAGPTSPEVPDTRVAAQAAGLATMNPYISLVLIVRIVD